MWFKFIYLILIVFINEFKISLQQGLNQNLKNNYLLVANKTAIYKFNELNLDSSLITHLPKDSIVKSLDYSFRDKLIFWINQLDSSININNVDNNRKINLFRAQITSPDNLAIDWLTKKIYWVDIEPYRIEVADFNGANNSLVLLFKNQIPKCLALAPLDGLLFWNDNEKNIISKISMNGLESTNKIIVNNTKAYSLTVDHNLKKIYWSDSQSKRIRSADFDGNNQRDILITFTPIITLNQNYIYYSDFIDKIVYSFDIIGRIKKKELIKFSDTIPYLNYFSQINQPIKKTQCSINNGGCSNLCLLSSETPFYSCSCPTGLQLLSDNKTCKSFPDDFLLIAFKNEIKYISLETNDYLPKSTKIKNQEKISSIDFDINEKRIYWIDRNKVKSAFINGTDEQLITECDLEYERLKLDTKNRNIYLVKNVLKFNRDDETKSSNFSIEVVSYDGKFKKTLVDDFIDRPRALALDIENEFIYFSDWGRHPKIEKLSFDLKVREKIVDKDIVWPNGILLDTELERLYWCDAKLYKIDYLDLNNYNKETLVRLENMSLLDLTLLGDYIYWSDTIKDQIGRVHKLTGKYEIISNKNQKLNKIMGLYSVSLNSIRNNSIEEKKSKNCSQFSLSRDLCACSDGYQLQNDSISCILGNNSCDLNNGNCDQNCHQIIGNYRKCSCNDGYILESDQKTCIEKKHDVQVFSPCPVPNPCSHDCFQIDNQYHCKCPSDQMYLHSDGINCLPYFTPNDKINDSSVLSNQINKNQNASSSTLTYVIILIIIVSISIILIIFIQTKRKKKSNIKSSAKNILERTYDPGFSFTNVENSFLYDRSVAGASNLNDNNLENQSLLDDHGRNPPPSPNESFNDDKPNYPFDYETIAYNSTIDNATFIDSTVNNSIINGQFITNDNFTVINNYATADNSSIDYCDINSIRKDLRINDYFSQSIYGPPPSPTPFIFETKQNNNNLNYKSNYNKPDYNRIDEFKDDLNESLNFKSNVLELIGAPPNSLNNSPTNTIRKEFKY